MKPHPGWKFFTRRARGPIIGVPIAIGLIILANIMGHNGVISGWWTNWFDPFATASTLIVASMAWYQSRTREWEEDLPERLTVHFKMDGKYVFTCWESQLTSEADIRSWAQQIGQQMNDNERLSFKPEFAIDGPIIKGDHRMGDARRVWDMTMILTKSDDEKKNLNAGAEKPLERNKYTIWYPSDTGIEIKEEDVRPELPISEATVRGLPGFKITM